MRTFLFLHAWAFILDILALIIASAALLISTHAGVTVFFIVIASIILIKAVELHLSVKRKYRARSILLKKNKAAFRQESFEEFMGAPCGRMLIKDVLIELDRVSEYKELRQKYYNGFFSTSKNTGLIIVQNTKK